MEKREALDIVGSVHCYGYWKLSQRMIQQSRHGGAGVVSPEEMKSVCQRDGSTPLFIEAFLLGAKTESTEVFIDRQMDKDHVRIC